MKLLLTGAAGMLGTDARRIFAEAGHEVVATDTGAAATGEILPMDITDPDAVRELTRTHRPDVIFHGAAYTNVDGCERDPDLAHKVNALGTWAVASAAEEIGASLVAISTDFVFDGAKGDKYTEFDVPNPLSHYGASKLAGENLARQTCRQTYVVRTSWLYGVHGKNFPYTMLALAKKNGELKVVGDQFGTPTYTIDLLNAVLDILDVALPGVYHVSNAGETSWHGFASAVMEKTGHADVPVHKLTSDEAAELLKTPTRRPPYSVLRHYALELMDRDTLRPWPDALDAFLAEARAQGKI